MRLDDVQELISQECDEIKNLLLSKNRKYGNSALEPVRVFSKCSSEEQIDVRIDDKLSRIQRGSADDEDVVLDLIGYLVLKRVYRRIYGSEPRKVEDPDKIVEILADDSDEDLKSFAAAMESASRTRNEGTAVLAHDIDRMLSSGDSALVEVAKMVLSPVQYQNVSAMEAYAARFSETEARTEGDLT